MELDDPLLTKVKEELSSCANDTLYVGIKPLSRNNISCEEMPSKTVIIVKNKRTFLSETCYLPSFLSFKLCQIRKVVPTDKPANTVTKSLNPLWIFGIVVLIICVLFCVCCVWQKRGNVSLLKLLCIDNFICI